MIFLSKKAKVMPDEYDEIFSHSFELYSLNQNVFIVVRREYCSNLNTR